MTTYHIAQLRFKLYHENDHVNAADFGSHEYVLGEGSQWHDVWDVTHFTNWEDDSGTSEKTFLHVTLDHAGTDDYVWWAYDNLATVQTIFEGQEETLWKLQSCVEGEHTVQIVLHHESSIKPNWYNGYEEIDNWTIVGLLDKERLSEIVKPIE